METVSAPSAGILVFSHNSYTTCSEGKSHPSIKEATKRHLSSHRRMLEGQGRTPDGVIFQSKGGRGCSEVSKSWGDQYACDCFLGNDEVSL